MTNKSDDEDNDRDEHDDICENYHGGNPESYEANDATTPFKERDRRRIREFLLVKGSEGAICDEMEVALELSHQTASARCSELLDDDVVRRKLDAQGKRIRRKTRTGCNASVLILKQFVPPVISHYDKNGQGMMF